MEDMLNLIGPPSGNGPMSLGGLEGTGLGMAPGLGNGWPSLSEDLDFMQDLSLLLGGEQAGPQFFHVPPEQEQEMHAFFSAVSAPAEEKSARQSKSGKPQEKVSATKAGASQTTGSGVQKPRKVRDEAAKSRRKAERKRAEFASLEATVLARMNELNLLEAENERLKRQHTVLERLVSMRTHQLEMIQTGLHPVTTAELQQPGLNPQAILPPSDPATPNHPGLQAHSSGNSGCSGSAQSAQPPTPQPSPSLHYSTSNLSRQPSTTSGSQNTSGGPSYNSATDSGGGDGGQGAVGDVSSQRPTRLLPHWLMPGTTLEQVQSQGPQPLGLHSSQHEALLRRSRPPTPGELQAYKELSPARFIAVWKTHLSNLSAMLLQLDMRPDDRRVVDGLVDGVVRMTFDFKHTSQQLPECIQKVMSVSLDSGKEEVPTMEHWRSLVRSLELSSAQHAELVTVYTAYRRLMARVLHERAQISATLREHGIVDTEAAMRNTVVSPECAVLKSLVNNLQREASLGTMLRGYVYGCVLSVVQMARCAVFSYPFFPNAISMLAIMWADEHPTGDPHPLAPTPPGTVTDPAAAGAGAGMGAHALQSMPLTMFPAPLQPPQSMPMTMQSGLQGGMPNGYLGYPMQPQPMQLQPMQQPARTSIAQHVHMSEMQMHSTLPDYMRPIMSQVPTASGAGAPGVAASALSSHTTVPTAPLPYSFY